MNNKNLIESIQKEYNIGKSEIARRVKVSRSLIYQFIKGERKFPMLIMELEMAFPRAFKINRSFTGNNQNIKHGIQSGMLE